MEVTRNNFETVLESLPEVFQKAHFIALDTEFTGLKVEGASGLNYYDTLEDLYLKNRLRAETFMAVQIGLVAFFYDEEVNQFSHAGYNFYVYPSSFTNVNFTCQSETLQFLIKHGFDFNKLIKEGVPYLKEDDMKNLLEKLKEKYEKSSHPESPTKIEIPNEHKSTISSIVNEIQDNLDKKISFTTEKHNSYIRRLIYNSVQSEFGSKIFLETNKDETMTIYVGYSSSELKEIQEAKFLEQKKEILNEVGFCKVIKLLIESKKLLIGHNLSLDLLFIIKQFLAPLPNNYSEFKELVSFVFPRIIDTKYMAGAEMKHIKDTNLAYLFEYFEKQKGFPEVCVHKSGVGYELQDKKAHEASFDAYLTGLCFLGIANHLGKLNCTSNIYKSLPQSPILEPFLNKLSIPRLYGILYMNLGGWDNEPDRQDIYHLTFPQEWTRENINDLFKNCGTINISWINSTSAFIKVRKEFIAEVENLILPNECYQLLSHSKFKSLNSNSAELLLSPLMEKRLGNSNKNSQTSSSPTKSNLTDTGLKRKMADEDIGELMPRPQKKRSSTRICKEMPVRLRATNKKSANCQDTSSGADANTTKKPVHKLQRRPGKTSEVRKYCKSCYEQNASQSGRALARKMTKKVATFCDTCEEKPSLCLPCFNKIH